MICRIWRGWTAPENAEAYLALLLGRVVPDIEAMGIPGFRHFDLLREDLGDEVQFTTLFWFDDIESIRAFVGADETLAHVPAEARAVLARFDARVHHHVVVERRPQS